MTVAPTSFIGTLCVQGSPLLSTDSGVNYIGGRIAFRSGYGTTGTNCLNMTAANGNAEYRFNMAGKSVRIIATAYTSGSVAVVITASQQPAMVFINGPVLTEWEDDIFAGRCFAASTGIQSVTNGNYLNYVLTNPTGSGVNLIIYRRQYGTDYTAAVLGYRSLRNVVALTSPTTVTPTSSNGASVSAVGAFTWKMQSTRIDTSPTTAAPGGGFMPDNGLEADIQQISVVQPGQNFGSFIAGSGGGLATTANLNANIFWCEKPVGS